MIKGYTRAIKEPVKIHQANISNKGGILMEQIRNKLKSIEQDIQQTNMSRIHKEYSQKLIQELNGILWL